MECIVKVLAISLMSCIARATQHSDHPCTRQCQVGVSLTCEYNFTVENYLTLSKACYSCPWNTTDCFRPHCISGNGAVRPVLAINRQIPGPSIEVCKGDKVRVWLENNLEDGGSVTLHWHGVTQMNSNFMDGVPGLTQCSIPPLETFRYEFYANNSGTHWYHSHTGFQQGDGLFGAFIVREPAVEERHNDQYDMDSGDHTMILIDWEDRPKITRYLEEMHDVWTWPVKNISVTVNGRGQMHRVPDIHNLTQSTTTVPTYTPMEVFTVMPNQRYRFRMISAATRCFLRVMIDSHQVMVIATDGEPIMPVQVGSIIIHPGERYDFVLSATEDPNDYWIKILGLGDCAPAGGFHAILHYDGYQGNADMMPTADKDDFDRNDTVLSPNPFDTYTNKILDSELRYQPASDDMDYTAEQVDVKKYIVLQYLTNDNSIYNHPDLYPVSSRLGMLTPNLNNITMKLPPIPYSTQWFDTDQSGFCNSETMDSVNDCNDDLCHCFHVISVELGQVVELFMYGYADDPHQMHLHGYTFRVVGTGVITLNDESDFLNVYLPDIIARDQNGEFPRNLVNPWKKDTVTVPSYGGYTIIRFKADNPGMWFFHCHNEGHMMQGMAMVIKVGNPTEFPRPSTFFPRCGGYNYQPSQQCDNNTSGATAFTLSIWLCVTLFVIFFM